MTDIARSAISERALHRDHTRRRPDAFVDGSAVGDMIHLLAELVDNATSFSPPQCPIDILAHAVGRGVVVEVRTAGSASRKSPGPGSTRCSPSRPTSA